MFNDLTQALRVWTRRPLVAISVVATLALGIGATTGVYSIYHGVLLKPMPFDDGERIVAIWIRDQSGAAYGISGGTLSAVKALPVVESAATVINTENTLIGSGESESIRGALVSGEFFNVAKVAPALGRLFGDGDARDPSGPVILSHRLWQRKFGGDLGVIGRAIRLGDRSRTVVGVMPAFLRYPEDAEYWLPYEIDATDSAQIGRGPFTAIARLRAGTLKQASAQAKLIRLSGPDATTSSVVLPPLVESIAGIYRSTLTMLFAAVAMVLLICCFNVANLLLAQSVHREREFVVRQALGATKWLLMRQLVAESVVLAILSCTTGVVVASLFVKLVIVAGAENIPRIAEASVDARALLFAIAATVVSVCIFAAFPLLASGRLDRVRSVGGTVSHPHNRRASFALIGLQIAGTLALLVGSVLSLLSLHRMHKADVGFDTHRLSVTPVRPSLAVLKQDRSAFFYERVLAGLREQNGFESVAAMSHVPLDTALPPIANVSTTEGVTVRAGAAGSRMRVVSAGVFKTLGVTVVEGREFSSDDGQGSSGVAIINETLKHRLWQASDPIGKTLSVESRGSKRSVTVVGVVRDFRQSVRRAPQPEVYVAFTQEPPISMKVLVRTALPDDVNAARIRESVFLQDPQAVVSPITRAGKLIDAEASYTKLHAMLLTVFGFIGVFLACAGIFAVVGYSVSRRTREVGVRIAIGATPRQVVALLIRDVTWPLMGGLLTGLWGVYQVGLVLRKQNVLFEVYSFEPVIFAAAALGLSMLAITAAWLPARRAAAIQPTITLRAD